MNSPSELDPNHAEEPFRTRSKPKFLSTERARAKTVIDWASLESRT